jgi:hypothetical protein
MVALARQREPAGRFAASDVGENFCCPRDALPLLIALQPTDILVPEAVRGDLMTLGGKQTYQIAMNMRDNRGDREGCSYSVLTQYLEQRCQALVGAK